MYCPVINFKDSEGNRIHIDDNGTTVTSPDGVKLYKYDSKHDDEVFMIKILIVILKSTILMKNSE